MDFKEFLPEDDGGDGGINGGDVDNGESAEEIVEKVGQNQVYGIITDKKPEWQSIIYDLINSEQLDPWDIDIVVLTSKYFEKIFEMEEREEDVDEKNSPSEYDFYLSSKVLFAAALLLRIKSEFLLNRYIKSIDDILFGNKNDDKKVVERIEIDFEDLPLLTPKTPMARLKKITLPELMSALNKAMMTESRRIKKEVAVKRAHKLSHVDIPKFRRIDLKDRIKQFYARILTSMRGFEGPDKSMNKMGYADLIGKEKEERLACFLPLLHLSNTQKLWLEQDGHLDEIWIYLYKYFDKNRDKFIEELEEDIEDMREELSMDSGLSDVKVSGLEKARVRIEEKKRLAEEVKRELMGELGVKMGDEGAGGVGVDGGVEVDEGAVEEGIGEEISRIEKEEKIDKVSGFGVEEV